LPLSQVVWDSHRWRLSLAPRSRYLAPSYFVTLRGGSIVAECAVKRPTFAPFFLPGLKPWFLAERSMHQNSRHRVSVGFAVTALLTVVTGLRADEAPSEPAQPVEAIPAPVQAFGRENLVCLEWSDTCIVCQRDADGPVHCSTPAIACLPQAVVCRREKP
jgi:hypothetical protein